VIHKAMLAALERSSGNDGLAAHSSGDYVEISCCDPRAFRIWSEDDFNDAIDVIVEARKQRDDDNTTKATLETVEQAFGFRATREGLLADVVLRRHCNIQRVGRYDWAHICLADGVLTSDAWALIDACEANGLATQQDVFAFLKEPSVTSEHRRRGGQQL